MNPGDTLGPFRVVRRIGLGGMGVVYEATDTGLDRPVALKVIGAHLAEDPAFRERFTREARAQASLDSPHVVPVHAFGDEDGRLYIASRLMPDGDLGALVQRRGVLAPAESLRLIAQVADGLSAAHAAGLVHRDIKPGNVLLRTRDGRLEAALGDFGIARRVDGTTGGLTVPGGTAGTPTYMAPELHLGTPAGPSSDVYAVGCLLWAALTGAPPYAGATDHLVVEGHLHGAIPTVGGTGRTAQELNRVLATALAKRPEERYPTAAALRDDLRRVAALDGSDGSEGSDVVTLPAGAAPPPPTRVVTGSVRRGRGKLVVAGSVVAVLAVVGVLVGVLLHGNGNGAGSDDGSSASRTTRAEAAIAAGYEHNFGALGLTDSGARCIARTMVDDVGLDAIIRAGILDDDLTFHTVSLAGSPDVDAAFQGAVTTCQAGPLGIGGG